MVLLVVESENMKPGKVVSVQGWPMVAFEQLLVICEVQLKKLAGLQNLGMQVGSGGGPALSLGLPHETCVGGPMKPRPQLIKQDFPSLLGPLQAGEPFIFVVPP